MSVMAIGESIVDIPFTKDKVAHPCLAASHYPIICKLKMRAYPLPISMYIIYMKCHKYKFTEDHCS